MKALRLLVLTVAAALVLAACMLPAFAASEPETDSAAQVAVQSEQTEDSAVSAKAIAAGIAIGLTAATGAVAMAVAIAKSTESMARQPEIAGKINSAMMLGLVFIETAIIYALIVAIIVIFVL